MSNNLNKPSQRAQVRSISDRVSMMEQNMTRFVWAVNQELQGIKQRLGLLEETVAALVILAGQDDVNNLVNDRRIEQAREMSDREKASLEEGIADGYVVSALKIDEKSLIVGRYTDAEGKVIEPGRAQLAMPGIAVQFRDQLMGQGVGFKLDMPEGGNFEVLEVYSVDDEKARQVLEEKQKKAAEEAVKAAGEAEAAQASEEN